MVESSSDCSDALPQQLECSSASSVIKTKRGRKPNISKIQNDSSNYGNVEYFFNAT
jgi:hypothetical protein